MEPFDDIQALWQTQEVSFLPGIKEVKISIAKYRDKKKNVFYLTILVLVAAFVTMLWVMYSYHSKLWTTRIGEVLILVTVMYVIYLKIITNKKVGYDELLDSNAFLDKLKNDMLETCTGSSNQQLIAFSMLCLAYFFYLYEALRDNVTTLITGYLVLAGVLALMWFVYRPFMIRRKRKSIRNFLIKIDKIKNQSI